MRNGRRMRLGFVTTRAWSTIPSKWDAENTVEEGRLCSLRRGWIDDVAMASEIEIRGQPLLLLEARKDEIEVWG